MKNVQLDLYVARTAVSIGLSFRRRGKKSVPSDSFQNLVSDKIIQMLGVTKKKCVWDIFNERSGEDPRRRSMWVQL